MEDIKKKHWEREGFEFVEFSFNKDDSFLILAPHQDDESIACAGLLLKYPKQCDVVVLTDGRFGGKQSPEENVAIRQEEFKNAMKFAGVRHYSSMNVIDKTMLDNIGRLKEIDFKKYSYVFVPSKFETHIDHYCIYENIKKLLAGSKTKVVAYEVWSALPEITHYIDISDIVDKKKELLNHYPSQLEKRDYKNRILGLNYYRGLRAKREYVEAFYLKK